MISNGEEDKACKFNSIVVESSGNTLFHCGFYAWPLQSSLFFWVFLRERERENRTTHAIFTALLGSVGILYIYIYIFGWQKNVLGDVLSMFHTQPSPKMPATLRQKKKILAT